MGHKLLLDGDILDITPDMSVGEVSEKLREHGFWRTSVMGSDSVVIFIGDRYYDFKDRVLGRCDFKSSPPPEDPICGD